jgi:PAS domain S-box-containing protein
MTEAVTNAREGMGWYIWSPEEGKEIAAWTPVRVGEYVWTIGLSMPLSEILVHTGVTRQTQTLTMMMGMGTLLALLLLLFAGGHGTWHLRRAERALRESESKFRQAFHHANDSMYLWTLHLDETPNRCIEANDVAYRTLGYSKEELATMSPRDIITAESEQEFDRIVQELVAQEQITFETMLVTKDNREIPAEVSAHTFVLNEQNVVLAISRDITERKRAEEALRELNATLETRVIERTIQLQAQYARLDAILNSTADGIVVTDEAGDIIQANPVAQAWLDQTLSPQEPDLLREMVQRVAVRAGEPTVELLELPERGLDLELSGAPIWEPAVAKVSRRDSKEPGAGYPAMVVAIHDVSHLKMLERMKTLFIANVSDELSQPVTTIKAFVYLIQALALDNPKLSDHLETLSQEVDYLEQMVKDVRRIYAVYTGRLQLDFGLLFLNKLTRSIIGNHRYLAQTRGVILEHRPTEPELAVWVDPDQVVQILNSLVGDAVRYTPKEGRVVVSTGREEADGQLWATVAVSDTGEMIPEEDMGHIFERFLRDEEPRNRRVSETGLRLMLASEIVALHQGRLTVESPSPVLGVDGQDVGSTFTVWLALAE